MGHKFQPGDRVRAINGIALDIGKVYTVESRTKEDDGVRLVGRKSDWSWHYDSRFEPVPEQRKVYLAGPMTDQPEYNFPAFNAAAARLRGLGLDVYNPAEHGAGGDWADYMRADIPHLLQSDVVVVLDGWHNSKGAKLEVRIAEDLGLPVIHFDDVEALVG